jgi:mono/diheme cytochrome c family protein
MLMMLTTRNILSITALTVAVGVATPLSAARQDAQHGEKVYEAQKCSVCHSIGGKGNKQNPLDGVGKKLTADEIRQWITNPTEMTAKVKSTKKSLMPNKYGSLPKADLDAIVAYLQSLK